MTTSHWPTFADGQFWCACQNLTFDTEEAWLAHVVDSAKTNPILTFSTEIVGFSSKPQADRLAEAARASVEEWSGFPDSLHDALDAYDVAPPFDREIFVQRCLDVLAPRDPEDGERMAIFDWGHETNPTEQETRDLCEQLVDAIFQPSETADELPHRGA